MAGAAGRVLTPDKEQAVYARRSGSSAAVTFYGPGSLQPSALLPNLADRTFNSTDFVDIAAADLDQVADTAGNNHVKDNGRGFDTEAAAAARRGLGLNGIAERARMLGCR